MRGAKPHGLLLAAGSGSRYGLPKILVDGWLDGAVSALRGGGCAAITVVTGAARPALPGGVREVHNSEWARGIGASLRAGLVTMARADPVVVHVVDCPDVGPAVISRVIGWGRDELVRATFDGRPGHPVILPRRHIAPLLAVLGDGDGASSYLRAHRTLTAECGDLATGLDIDTPVSATSGNDESRPSHCPGSPGTNPGGDRLA